LLNNFSIPQKKIITLILDEAIVEYQDIDTNTWEFAHTFVGILIFRTDFDLKILLKGP